MKRNLFLYLFLFAALYCVFLFVNSKKGIQTLESKITKMEAAEEEMANNLEAVESKLFDAEYFTINGNENAYTYFEKDGYDLDTLVPMIQDHIYATNSKEGSSLVPFDGIRGPFQINKVQVLNHKWIIADFSDGEFWGELFIKYYLEENKEVTLEVVESLLYPKRRD